MNCLNCGQPLTDAEAVWRVVHEGCESTKKEAPVEVDTKKIREKWGGPAYKYNIINAVEEIDRICSELDRLRAEDARVELKQAQDIIKGYDFTKFKEMEAKIARLTAEVARLKEKAGEEVCHCGKAFDVRKVALYVEDRNATYLTACPDCIDRALDALKGK